MRSEHGMEAIVPENFWFSIIDGIQDVYFWYNEVGFPLKTITKKYIFFLKYQKLQKLD